MASSTKWVAMVTDRATARAIAAKINRSHTSVAGWLRRDVLPCDVVLQIAIAYGGDPIEGLIAAGHLKHSDVDLRNLVRLAPSSYLTEELHQRSRSFDQALAEGKPWRSPHRGSLILVRKTE